MSEISSISELTEAIKSFTETINELSDRIELLEPKVDLMDTLKRAQYVLEYSGNELDEHEIRLAYDSVRDIINNQMIKMRE